MTAASQPPSPPAVSPCWPRLGFPPGHGLLTSHQPLCACFLHSSRTLARPVMLIPDTSRVARGAGVPWLTSQPEGWPLELCPGSCCTTESALREGDTPYSGTTGTAVPALSSGRRGQSVLGVGSFTLAGSDEVLSPLESDLESGGGHLCEPGPGWASRGGPSSLSLGSSNKKLNPAMFCAFPLTTAGFLSLEAG